jgi:hypothetical protein
VLTTLSPFSEGFSVGTLWAHVLSSLVMRSDFVQIEAAIQHLKIVVQGIKMGICAGLC